jgi:hypothetical protein
MFPEGVSVGVPWTFGQCSMFKFQVEWAWVPGSHTESRISKSLLCARVPLSARALFPLGIKGERWQTIFPPSRTTSNALCPFHQPSP